jgi:hypothetical protein
MANLAAVREKGATDSELKAAEELMKEINRTIN